jgi:hypothetical protein
MLVFGRVYTKVDSLIGQNATALRRGGYVHCYKKGQPPIPGNATAWRRGRLRLLLQRRSSKRESS